MRGVGTLVLAAGRSSRMGRHKALLAYRGRTVLEHQVALYSQFGPVWVAVSEALAPEVQQLVIPAPTLVMANPAPGLFSTVQPCLARLRCRIGQLFVIPVDAILPDGGVPERLLESLCEPYSVCVPTHQDRPGHPVLLGGVAIAHVAEQDRGRRFDDVLAELGPLAVPVDEPRIHLNINTPDDYNCLLALEADAREEL